MKNGILKYISSYKYKIEFHAHTTPELPPEKMISLLKEQGYHAVLLTNHFLCCDDNYNKGEEYVKDFLDAFYKTEEEGKKNNIKVFMGVEIRFAEGRNEFLTLGADENLLKDALSCGGIEEFHKKFHTDDIFVIQAHPFRTHCDCFPVNPEFLDGMEIMNMHPEQMSANAVAAKYASNTFSVVTAGTDVHYGEHIGLSAIKTRKLPNDIKEFIEIIKCKDYIFEIGGNPMFPYTLCK